MKPLRLRFSLQWLAKAALDRTVLLTLIASLALSVVSLSTATLNRDGMLYVRTARAFIEGGLSAAVTRFNWPFMPILMATISRLTGLDLEIAGHVANALFMAGASALMVACIQKVNPKDSLLAALIILSIPGLNEYRGELLREYGCWFFVMLSFWLALRWAERPTWLGITAVQAALGFAALFRSEAIALYPACIAWQLFDAPKEERISRLAMLFALPIATVACIATAYLSIELPTSSRLSRDLERISLSEFNNKALVLSSALIDYAHDNARAILFFGSLALVPIKLVQKLGIFTVALMCAVFFGKWRSFIARFPLFCWAIALNILVLSVFVLDLQFLAGRYVGLTLLLSTPLLVSGARSLADTGPRWKRLIIVVLVITMLSNVISISQGKRHYVEAGKWLSENVSESEEVYIDSGRTAYFANWEQIKLLSRGERKSIEESVVAKRYKFYVLEVSKRDLPIDTWLVSTGLHVIRRFGDVDKDSVIVAQPDINAEVSNERR